MKASQPFCAVAVALLLLSSSALAQGTATGPFTSAIVTAGPEVLIGSAASPIQIDLDPTGNPWTKSITDPAGLITVSTGEPLDLVEFIENVGTESWGDWHEHIAPNGAGLPDSTWISVALLVNGNPITFDDMGLGMADLWLDNFSQPVLPGDILEIRKVVEVFPVMPTNSGPILRLEEYPTPIPEPACLALASIAIVCGTTMVRRRLAGKLMVVAALLSAVPTAEAAPVTGWITGTKGAIANTTDGGVTPWNSQTSGVSVELTRADAVDTNNAWAVGDQGTIVHTNDGGATWVTQTNVTPVLTSSDVLRGLDFIDVNSGWAVGRRVSGSIIGVVTRTTDGGSSWSSQTLGTDESIVDVDFIPGTTTGWLVGGEIAGTASVIRKTTDGNTWSAPVVLPGPIATGILDGVEFVDLLTGWAVGGNGKIIKTTDGGANWIQQTSGTTTTLSAVTFQNAQLGWAISTIGGEILKTTNGGTSWSIANVNPNYVLRDIAFVDTSNGWVVGSDITNFPNSTESVLLATSDGGSTWTPQITIPANLELLSGLAVVVGIPEPTSCLLMVLGLAVTALRRS